VKQLSSVVLVRRHVPGAAPFPGPEPLFRRLHTVRRLGAAVRGVRLRGYGWDAEALRNGTLSLLHARGILPDGLAFHMPECDPLPPARNISDLFPPTATSSPCCWPSPSGRPTGSTAWPPVRSTARAPATWPKRSRFPTKHRARREAGPVGAQEFLAAARYRGAGRCAWHAVARVMRDGTGHFIFDPEFIPPRRRSRPANG